MLAWLSNNIATVIISLVLAVIVALIIFSLVKNKKKGKSSCGCNCAHCAMSGSCHGAVDIVSLVFAFAFLALIIFMLVRPYKEATKLASDVKVTK